MNYDATFFNYFLHASIVVKCVIFILVAASICSWTYILQRIFYLQNIRHTTAQFEHAFWSGEDLSKLYAEGNKTHHRDGMESIFHAGFKEFLRFRKQHNAPLEIIIENTRRAMQVAQMRMQNNLEKHLTFLAIVGSTSPYVGLFGTVWGIMQSFRSLANVQQATIPMIAPGIAEALIATAFGLFAAIPAVIAYNRFVANIGHLTGRFDAFKEEFTNILIRQAQPATTTSMHTELME